MTGTCATDGCPNRAQRMALHCAECEREIVGAIEATHGPLVGGEQGSLFAPPVVACASCGRPGTYRRDLRTTLCTLCASLARGAA